MAKFAARHCPAPPGASGPAPTAESQAGCARLAFALSFASRQVILIVAAMLVLMNVINAIYAVDPRDTLQYALYNLGYSELIILHSLQPRVQRTNTSALATTSGAAN